MANEKNLKPFTSEQSHEEAVRNGQKGGIKSGEARRLKNASRERLINLLNSPVNSRQLKKLLKDYNSNSIDESNHDLLISSLFMNAIHKGDAKLYKLILDIIGENTESEENGELERLIEGLKNE